MRPLVSTTRAAVLRTAGHPASTEDVRVAAPRAGLRQVVVFD